MWKRLTNLSFDLTIKCLKFITRGRETYVPNFTTTWSSNQKNPQVYSRYFQETENEERLRGTWRNMKTSSKETTSCEMCPSITSDRFSCLMTCSPAAKRFCPWIIHSGQLWLNSALTRDSGSVSVTSAERQHHDEGHLLQSGWLTGVKINSLFNPKVSELSCCR